MPDPGRLTELTFAAVMAAWAGRTAAFLPGLW
jgi:hypothetical protein